MSGYIHRLTVLRAAARGTPPEGGPEPYQPWPDLLIRRIAERLSDELVADVVELIKLARESP